MEEENIIFNFDRLIGRIIEKYKTRENFASKIHMSIPTLVNKLSGRVDFRSKEIFKICNVLEIPLEEIPEFFYQIS